MANEPRFIAAYPFQDDVLSLPVADLDGTSDWYTMHFGMTEVERTDRPVSRVILERDDARIGFAVNGGDASQDGDVHPSVTSPDPAFGVMGASARRSGAMNAAGRVSASRAICVHGDERRRSSCPAVGRNRRR